MGARRNARRHVKKRSWKAPWHLGSKEAVYDRVPSHIHGVASSDMQAVLKSIRSMNRYIIRYQHDFGRIVGKSRCVATELGDEIIYARRVGRNSRSRFVLNRDAEPTSKVSVVLVKRADGRGYRILTAYYGTLMPVEPWDMGSDASDGSKELWRSHAFVYDPREVVQNTIEYETPS